MGRASSFALALGSRLAFVATVLAAPGFIAFVAANGLGVGALLPGLLAVESVTLAVVLRRKPPSRRGLQAAVVGALLVGVVVAVRLAGSGDGAVLICRETCDRRGAWWQRLFEERDTVQAGLLLSRALGATDARELREFREVFARAYEGAPRGGPNALLMSSRSGSVTSLRAEPGGTTPLPTLVFLHGFGGLLTPYVEALSRESNGRYLVVAPALDPVGAWRTRRGQAVLRATLAQLPPRADRSRVFLVGLSNGALGALEALEDPALRAQLAGVVLVSGIGFVPPAVALDGTRVLVVAGAEDARFPIDFVTEKTAELRERGAEVDVVTLPATHALILSHAPQWFAAFERWAR